MVVLHIIREMSEKYHAISFVYIADNVSVHVYFLGMLIPTKVVSVMITISRDRSRLVY